MLATAVRVVSAPKLVREHAREGGCSVTVKCAPGPLDVIEETRTALELRLEEKEAGLYTTTTWRSWSTCNLASDEGRK